MHSYDLHKHAWPSGMAIYSAALSPEDSFGIESELQWWFIRKNLEAKKRGDATSPWNTANILIAFSEITAKGLQEDDPIDATPRRSDTKGQGGAKQSGCAGVCLCIGKQTDFKPIIDFSKSGIALFGGVEICSGRMDVVSTVELPLRAFNSKTVPRAWGVSE